MVATKARHLQRIRHAATGFLGQVLQIGIHVVMRDQHGLPLLEQPFDAGLQFIALLARQHGRHLGPGMGDAAGAGLLVGEHVRAIEFNRLDVGFHDDLPVRQGAAQVAWQ